MKVGDIVDIFEDPITKKSLEGRAVLVKQIEWNDGGLGRWDDRLGSGHMEKWEVRFEDEQKTFERTILV